MEAEMFELSTVPEYAKSLARFEAWWHGEIADRTPVSPWVPPQRACTRPAKAYPRVRDRWSEFHEAMRQLFIKWKLPNRRSIFHADPVKMAEEAERYRSPVKDD